MTSILRILSLTATLVFAAFPLRAEPLADAGTALKTQLDRIEAKIDALKPVTVPVPTPAPAPVPTPAPAPAALKPQVSMCATGCDATSLRGAYDLTADGGTITIKPGEYPISKDVVFKRSMTVRGHGAHLKSVPAAGATGVSFAKAPIVAEAARLRVEGLEISGVRSSSGNGACVRGGPGVKLLEIIKIKCYGAQMGVLLSFDDGDVLIEDSEIFGTYSGSLSPHVLYITKANHFTLRNSIIHSSPGKPALADGTKLAGGHLVKTGAVHTLIENSILAALSTKTARTIDAFGGGELIVRDSVLQVNNNANWEFMSFGVEPSRLNPGPHRVELTRNTFINDYSLVPPRSYKLFYAPSLVEITGVANGNVLVGMIGGWPVGVVESGNARFANRTDAGLPAYDGSLGSMRK